MRRSAALLVGLLLVAGTHVVITPSPAPLVAQACALSAPANFDATYSGGAVTFRWDQDPTGCARSYQIFLGDLPYASVPDAGFWKDPSLRPGAHAPYSVAAIGPETLVRWGPRSPVVIVSLPPSLTP